MRILTPAEFELVAERIHPHYRGFVRFLAGTGARFGEAVALQVQDVTLPDIRIRRALKWSPDRAAQRIAAPKTRRGNRTIRIGAALAPDVAGACQGKARADLVWTAPKGGSIQHRTFWSDIWLPAVVDLEPRPRIHDLRHSHASWLIAQGVPLIVVQRRLGHESIKTTGDTYGHLLPDAELAATLAADAALGYAPHPELD
jgi:integrase